MSRPFNFLHISDPAVIGRHINLLSDYIQELTLRRNQLSISERAIKDSWKGGAAEDASAKLVEIKDNLTSEINKLEELKDYLERKRHHLIKIEG